MNRQAVFLDAVGLDGRTLRVEFVKHGDRFGHVISLAERDALTPLLESVEGTGDDAWPASPPLQSVHLELMANGRRVALLVGMAGRSHWSASIEADPKRPAILFDIACRTSGAGARLGSRYKVLSPAGSWKIADTLASTTIIQTASEVQIDAAPVEGSGPWTVRWRYEIALLTDH